MSPRGPGWSFQTSRVIVGLIPNTARSVRSEATAASRPDLDHTDPSTGAAPRSALRRALQRGPARPAPDLDAVGASPCPGRRAPRVPPVVRSLGDHRRGAHGGGDGARAFIHGFRMPLSSSRRLLPVMLWRRRGARGLISQGPAGSPAHDRRVSPSRDGLVGGRGLVPLRAGGRSRPRRPRDEDTAMDRTATSSRSRAGTWSASDALRRGPGPRRQERTPADGPHWAATEDQAEAATSSSNRRGHVGHRRLRCNAPPQRCVPGIHSCVRGSVGAKRGRSRRHPRGGPPKWPWGG